MCKEEEDYLQRDFHPPKVLNRARIGPIISSSQKSLKPLKEYWNNCIIATVFDSRNFSIPSVERILLQAWKVG